MNCISIWRHYIAELIARVDRNMQIKEDIPIISRVTKQLSTHRLVIYQQQKSLVFKAFEVSPLTKAKKVLICTTAFSELHSILRINFTNVEQMIEEFKVTPNKHFTIHPNLTLTLQLQIGSKLKEFNFKLQEKVFTYYEEIQYCLSQTQDLLSKTQSQKANISDIQRLEMTISRQSAQINNLTVQLREQKKEAKQNAQINRLATELVEEKMKRIQMQRKCEEINEKQVVMEQAMKKITLQLLKVQKQKLENRVVRRQEIMNAENIGEKVKEKQEEEIDAVIRKSRKVVNNEVMQISSCTPPICSLIDQANSLSSEDYEFFQTFKFDIDHMVQSESNSFYKHNQRFKLKQTNGTAKQFCSTLHLARPKAKLTLRLIKTRNHNIWFGLILANRIHERRTKRQIDAFSYKLKGGRQMYEDGVRYNVNIPMIKEGRLLSIEVNSSSGKIKWFYDSKLICQRTLEKKFCEELYPFVTMVDSGDEVSFQ